ncbi:MAG: hypothetical protein QOG04_2428 [Actinomycetota bacterium]|nr:hypothetical protein [Actinomycetota bacterium]
MTKKSIALSMSLAILGGLLASAFTATSQAATVKSHATEFTTPLKYADGQFSGRLAGKRFLCLQDQDVVIMKDLASGLEKVTVAHLNVGTRVWQNFGEAKFTAKHPALDITNRRKRNRALHGTYFAKFVESPVAAGYGKAGICLGDRSAKVEI